MTQRKYSEEPWFVASVDKAFRVLSAFEKSPFRLSLAEIAAATGLDKSAAQRFTYTLSALGYLRKDGVTRRYGASPKLLGLALTYLRTDELVARASYYLRELNSAISETTNLTELDGTDVIYVLRVPGRYVMTTDVMVGSRRPAYCTATGRAILSAMPVDDARRVLAESSLVKYQPQTKIRIPEIWREIERARAQGYAVCVGESMAGDISIAAPVQRRPGHVDAAVNVSVQEGRWKVDEAVRRFAPLVVQVARAISEQAGDPWRTEPDFDDPAMHAKHDHTAARRGTRAQVDVSPTRRATRARK